MTRARNIAGFSTITTTPSPVHVGPIGVLTATRIDGEFNKVDLNTRELTAQGIGVTNLQISGITTGLNVSGIITAQNGINFNGTSTGLNVSGVTTVADLTATTISIGGTLTYEDVTSVDSVGVVTARGLSIFGNTSGLNVASGISTFQAVTGTTGTFSGLSVFGNTSGLNVASGISTFQAVTGTTGTFSGDLTIADSIVHSGDTNTKIRFSGADTFNVETGGSERLRVDSTGQVRIFNQLYLTDNVPLYLGNANDLSLFHDSTDSRIRFNHTVGDLKFQNNSNDNLMVLDASGRLLLGTTTEGYSGADDFTIATTGSTGISIRSASGNAGNIAFSDGTSGDDEQRGLIQYHHSDDTMRFFTNATRRITIDSSGHLKIGTTANRNLGGLSVQRLHIEGTDGGGSGIGVVNNQNSTGFPSLRFGKSRGTSVGSNTIVQNNDTLGGLIFCGADGTDIDCIGAEIKAFVDGTPGSNDMPGRIAFKTAPDGSSTTTERLSIRADGRVKIGSSTAGVTNEKCQLTLTHNNSNGIGIIDIDSYGSATLLIQSNWSGSAANGVPHEAFGFGTPHAYPLTFQTSGTERLRIAADGTIIGQSNSGIPLQQRLFKSATAQVVANTSETRLTFTEITFTAKQAGTTLVYEYVISGELDGGRDNSFYRLYYSTDNWSSATNLPLNHTINGGNGDTSNGTFNDVGFFYFTNPSGTTATKYALYYRQSVASSTEFNQQGLSSQPGGTTSNYSFFKMIEYPT